MDFVADQLFDGRRFRLSTLMADFTRKSLVIDVGQRLTGDRVAEALDRVKRQRGARLAKIRVDNGSKFTSRRLDRCVLARSATWLQPSWKAHGPRADQGVQMEGCGRSA